jgi:hypothetical protein
MGLNTSGKAAEQPLTESGSRLPPVAELVSAIALISVCLLSGCGILAAAVPFDNSDLAEEQWHDAARID